jgi:hypothetical protein
MLRWAARLCRPDVLDTVVEPIVADLQFEDHEATGGGAARLGVRLRYLGVLVKALGLHYATEERGTAVIRALVSALRWGLLVPAALGASLLAQLVIATVAAWTLYSVRGHDWSTWAVKAGVAPVMAAAFVATAWLFAPVRKNQATSVALGAVAVWGGLLMVGAFARIGDGLFHAWLLVIGSTGILGGIVPWYLVRRWPSSGGRHKPSDMGTR